MLDIAYMHALLKAQHACARGAKFSANLSKNAAVRATSKADGPKRSSIPVLGRVICTGHEEQTSAPAVIVRHPDKIVGQTPLSCMLHIVPERCRTWLQKSAVCWDLNT